MNKTANAEQQLQVTTNDPRWQRVMSRDRSADGSFYYSVNTTGVYCRPSCGARLPRPENVRFHTTIEDAERAGFRACKRCRPAGLSLTQKNAAVIARICRLIEQAETPPSLALLARTASMSDFHFHRTFKAATGLTPGDYARAHRSQRARAAMDTSRTVTDAIYEAGFNTNSRFYEASDKVLGMTPTDFRSGGAHTSIHFAIAECSLGSILVARSDRGVCAIFLGDDPQQLARDLQDKFPKAEIIGDDSGYENLIAKVVGLVETPGTRVDLPLDIRGTVFQQKVWMALQKIPAGKTATYTEIAEELGMPTAARAVAQACGANTLAVAIPCHRVIRNDGGLAGYRWGVERKRDLLTREAKG